MGLGDGGCGGQLLDAESCACDVNMCTLLFWKSTCMSVVVAAVGVYTHFPHRLRTPESLSHAEVLTDRLLCWPLGGSRS